MTFGAREAAWPLIRADLRLSYVEIGVLLALPGLFSSVIEPAFGILSDAGRRRGLILGGGVVFSGGLLLVAASQSFFPLLVAFMLLYPASGAFVSLSQAVLMDHDPARREQNMARWTFAGSIGVVAGPLLISAAVALGAGWRGTMLGLAVFAAGVLFLATRLPLTVPTAPPDGEPGVTPTFRDGLRGTLRALRRGEVIRWLVLLQFSDLMLDILYGLLALYFVDVAGITPERAGLAVAIWTGVGLLGDFLLIPLLERVRGLPYLRVSAAITLVLFPAFLLAPRLEIKLILLAGLGLFNSGWYAILQARLYAALPGQSGTALAVNNVAGLAGSLIPFGLGIAAQAAGLEAAMWLLLAGPLALLVGLPRHALPDEERPPGADDL